MSIQKAPALPAACASCWRQREQGAGPRPSCFDVSHWPVVHLLSIGANTEEIELCRIKQLELLMSGNHRFSMVIEPRQAKSGRRNLIFEWINQNQARVQKHCAGIALVMSSMLVRFMISSALLILRRPIAYKACATFEDALAWAGELLKQDPHKTTPS